MTTVTVPSRGQVKKGAGTVVSAVPVSPPAYAKYSLHDCQEVWQAGLHNCIWPVNLGATNGKTFVNGLVVMSSETTGTVTVTHV